MGGYKILFSVNKALKEHTFLSYFVVKVYKIGVFVPKTQKEKLDETGEIHYSSGGR